MKLPPYNLLSREQSDVYELPLEGKFLIVGPPGSGKTVIALHMKSDNCNIE